MLGENPLNSLNSTFSIDLQQQQLNYSHLGDLNPPSYSREYVDGHDNENPCSYERIGPKEVLLQLETTINE